MSRAPAQSRRPREHLGGAIAPPDDCSKDQTCHCYVRYVSVNAHLLPDKSSKTVVPLPVFLKITLILKSASMRYGTSPQLRPPPPRFNVECEGGVPNIKMSDYSNRPSTLPRPPGNIESGGAGGSVKHDTVAQHVEMSVIFKNTGTPEKLPSAACLVSLGPSGLGIHRALGPDRIFKRRRYEDWARAWAQGGPLARHPADNYLTIRRQLVDNHS